MPRRNSSPLSSPARRQRRLKRALLAVVIYAVVGFLILPTILRWQLEKQLPKFTQRQAAVKQVRVNPFALSLTIRGLALTETNGEPFAAFDEFYANFQLSSLFRWAWTFDEVSLTHPTALLRREADGTFNFANLLTNAPPADAPPASTNGLPAALLHRLVVSNGVVTVEDRTRATPFRHDYGPIDLHLTGFTTRRDQDGPYAFTATTSHGESFAWSGRVSVNPLQSAGDFKLAGIPLAKYAPFAADFITAHLTNGTLAVAASYRLDAAQATVQLLVSNAAVELRDLELLTPAGDELLLAVTNLIVADASGSLAAREARVGRVEINGGALLARREADGGINLLKLVKSLPAAPVASDPAPAPPPAAPWSLVISEVAVTGFNVSVQDYSTPTSMRTGLDALQLGVTNFSTVSNTPLGVTVSFQGRDGGSARLEAQGTWQPIAVEARLAATNLPLAPLQPYAEQYTHLVVHSGDSSVTGTFAYQETDPAVPRLRFNADMSLTGFKASETLSREELARFDKHMMRGVALELDHTFQPKRVAIEEVLFRGLNAGVTVLSNGQINLLAIEKKRADAQPKPPADAPKPPAQPLPNLRVGAVVLEDSAVFARDQSVTPRFFTSIEAINARITDITLPEPGRIGLELSGKFGARGPFTVTGAVLPDVKNPFVDTLVKLDAGDLTPFTPYAEKFLGYPLNKGALSLDLRYSIRDRRLNASNVVALDQFTLGARTDSTSATKLPVKLAVALLKDREGRIALDLPVTGSLDDPKFHIGRLVTSTLVNLLVKVATSPFSLLGAAFGGGEELQFADFAPGTAAFAAGETNKLEKLAKALYERPALNLEIVPSFDPAADRAAVGRRKLLDAMKALHAAELAERKKPVPPLAEITLEDGEYERLLRKAYKEAFNTTPERALREAREAAAATNAPGAAGAPVPKTSGTGKGSAQLLTGTRPAPTPTTDGAKPKTEDELIRDELEQRLMGAAPVTEADALELMKQRAEAVVNFFLETGKVERERLLPATPKNRDPAAAGAARTTFSLN